MKNKYGFLILHYMVFSETRNSVLSILHNHFKEDYEILIVDNGSSNDSGKQLKNFFKKNNNVHVIHNNKNLGFANGNNVGFKILKVKFLCNFIIMMNNDILITDRNFLSKINIEYKKSGFAVLGPKIVLPDGKIDNCDTQLPTINDVKKSIIKNKLIIFLNYIYLYNLIVKIVKFINPNIYQKKNKKIYRLENVVLHGSCMIFSKQYIKSFNGLDNRTFLYYEEQLLYIRIVKNNLKSVYNPEISVIHNESCTTKIINKNLRNKNIFVSKNLNKSAKILISELIKRSDK